MTTKQTKISNKNVRQFQNSFRRALLMHREGRAHLFFKLLFPRERYPQKTESAVLVQLNVFDWLKSQPPSSIESTPAYQDFAHWQKVILDAANIAVEAAKTGKFSTAQFHEIANAMKSFDNASNRLVSLFTESLADIDGLTGLFNRSALDRDLVLECEQFSLKDAIFCLALIDLDHFKNINDTYGHGFGDIVLEQMAEGFLSSVRPSDRVYRYGGEEFLVLMPLTKLAEACAAIERLRQEAEEKQVGNEATMIHQTVSVGVVEIQPSESGIEALKRADAFLYCAKRNGRNCVVAD